MNSSIEENNRGTSMVLVIVSLYSAFFLQVAVLAALAAAGFFGATTQVWQYPVPRLDFASISGALLFGSVVAYLLHWIAEGAVRFLQSGNTSLGLLAFLTSLIAALVLFNLKRLLAQLTLNQRVHGSSP